MLRLAKIIATIGPSTSEPENIERLLDSGVDVLRLNCSHSDHEMLAKIIDHVRKASQMRPKTVAILVDLQGPKLRLNHFVDHQPILLEKEAFIRLKASDDLGNDECLAVKHPEIFENLSVGSAILLADGAMEMKITEMLSSTEVRCEILRGGLLEERKGINLPGIKLNIPALTKKDKADVKFALEQGVDYIALSFVQSFQDVVELRWLVNEYLPEGQKPPRIVAKFERPQALDGKDAIMDAADAVMIARGDLGVEMNPEQVPAIQKSLIETANRHKKPVITATQMLETMIENAQPTRAEVSDVANAVYDGTDALMLSGETAVGKYPMEAVGMMARIIKEAESSYRDWAQATHASEFWKGSSQVKEPRKHHEIVAESACYAALTSKVNAIIVLSYSGSMARRISKRKPGCPIVALTPHPRVHHQLALLWGVYPIKIPFCETAAEVYSITEEAVIDCTFLQSGMPVIFCAGRTHLKEMTNIIKMFQLGEILQPHQ